MDKCTKEHYCDALSERLELSNEHKKGLIPINLTNSRTWKDRHAGIAYRTKPSDNGLMLNYCPWCGEKILWDDEETNHV